MMDRMAEQQFHGLVHCGDISYANGFNHSRPNYAEQVCLQMYTFHTRIFVRNLLNSTGLIIDKESCYKQ